MCVYVCVCVFNQYCWWEVSTLELSWNLAVLHNVIPKTRLGLGWTGVKGGGVSCTALEFKSG